jgi:hypothetical protein
MFVGSVSTLENSYAVMIALQLFTLNALAMKE